MFRFIIVKNPLFIITNRVFLCNEPIHLVLVFPEKKGVEMLPALRIQHAESSCSYVKVLIHPKDLQ